MKTNKKLIKQLERCGFEKRFTPGRGVYYSDQEVMKCAYPFCTFYAESDTFEVYLHFNGPEVDIKSPTFAQIAAAIKEHTGEELKPKPTKAQRIEALTKRIEALEQKDKDVPTLTKEEAKQLDWEAKEYEKDSKRCLQKLDEMATKPVFEVGDWVVLNEDAKLVLKASDDRVLNTSKSYEVEKIAGGSVLLATTCGTDYYFQHHYLQHAPKEAAKVLKFGESYELGAVSESAAAEGYLQGDIVVYLGKGQCVGIVKYMKEGCELKHTSKENLKPI